MSLPYSSYSYDEYLLFKGNRLPDSEAKVILMHRKAKLKKNCVTN